MKYFNKSTREKERATSRADFEMMIMKMNNNKKEKVFKCFF
jgi:hypothetical protein